MRSLISKASLALLLCSSVAAGAEPAMGGIGLALTLDKETQRVKIVRVLPNSPAAKAGIVSGTFLLKIDAKAVQGENLTNCVARIRGPTGTAVSLEMVDPKSHTTNQIAVVRAILDPANLRARLGDPAAPLAIKEWMRGEPVNVRDGKAIYVVEFWATWCGPCRITIPHLSSLQKQFKEKGVVVVGISDEPPSTVKPFLTQMGPQMDYTVACDDDYQSTTGYMDAYGFNTIPTAFIVGRDGRVVWGGNPLNGLDQALQKLVEEKHKL